MPVAHIFRQALHGKHSLKKNNKLTFSKVTVGAGSRFQVKALPSFNTHLTDTITMSFVKFAFCQKESTDPNPKYSIRLKALFLGSFSPSLGWGVRGGAKVTPASTVEVAEQVCHVN